MSVFPVAHSSSPAVVKVSNGVDTVATAAFDPPSRIAFAVGITSDSDNATGAVPTISSTAGLAVTWTLKEGAGYTGVGGDVGLCALWAGVLVDPDTDLGSITVTVDTNISFNPKPKMLIVRVYDETQVDISDPIGVTAKGAYGAGVTAITSGPMVPETNNGGLRMLSLDWGASGTPTVFQSNTELVDAYHNAGLSTNWQLGKSTPTVAGVSETIGATKPAASSDGNWIAYELRGPQVLAPSAPILTESGLFLTTESGVPLMTEGV